MPRSPAGSLPLGRQRLLEIARALASDPVLLLLVDRLAVLDFGTKIAEGTPAEVRRDARVLEAYLGTPA